MSGWPFGGSTAGSAQPEDAEGHWLAPALVEEHVRRHAGTVTVTDSRGRCPLHGAAAGAGAVSAARCLAAAVLVALVVAACGVSTEDEARSIPSDRSPLLRRWTRRPPPW